GNLAEAGLDGDLPMVLLRIVVHGRRAGHDRPHLRNRPARTENSFDQRRLAGSAVGEDGDIADGIRLGFLHTQVSRLDWKWRHSRRGRETCQQRGTRGTVKTEDSTDAWQVSLAR